MPNTPSVPERIYGESFRTTMVYVDSAGPEGLSGRVYNPYLGRAVPFSGTLDLLEQMERMFDRMRLPQSSTSHRTFAGLAPAETGPPPESWAQAGELATFAVRVLFRHNASWQGSVTWIEEKQEERFRSVLELLMLAKSALDRAQLTT